MSETSPKTRIIARAVGRRKEAIASVRLVPGSGKIIANGLPAEEYFSSPHAQIRLTSPFRLLSLSKYSATAKVHGGGKTGQLDAIVLGLSRTLAGLKSDYKSALRNAGLLTRDPRVRQRRQVGMGGKSRRKKQSPKR